MIEFTGYAHPGIDSPDELFKTQWAMNPSVIRSTRLDIRYFIKGKPLDIKIVVVYGSPITTYPPTHKGFASFFKDFTSTKEAISAFRALEEYRCVYAISEERHIDLFGYKRAHLRADYPSELVLPLSMIHSIYRKGKVVRVYTGGIIYSRVFNSIAHAKVEFKKLVTPSLLFD